MGRRHQRVDWPWMEYHTTERWEPGGVEEAGCEIWQWSPNDQPDCGIGEVGVRITFCSRGRNHTKLLVIKTLDVAIPDHLYKLLIVPRVPPERYCGKTSSIPPRWPSGLGVHLGSGRSGVRFPLTPWGFFSIESYQWSKNVHSSGYSASRLAL